MSYLKESKIRFAILYYFSRGVKLPESFIRKYTKTPIFLIGSQRSGTGFCRSIINRSDEVCDWTEANYVWEPHYYNFLTGKKEINIPGFKGKGIHAHEIPDRCRDRKQKIVRKIFAIYCFLNRRKRLLHKNPFNSVRANELIDFFPDCKIVNVLRDVRAVIRSSIFKHYPSIESIEDKYSFIDSIIYRWRVCRDRFLQINKKYPDRTTEVKYSNLGDSNYINRLFDFLDLELKKEVEEKVNEFKNMNFKYKRDLDKETINYIENKVENPTPDSVGLT